MTICLFALTDIVILHSASIELFCPVHSFLIFSHPNQSATPSPSPSQLEFLEDFNTCTMPSEKYYDLEKWEKNQGLQTEFTGKQMSRRDYMAGYDGYNDPNVMFGDDEKAQKNRFAALKIQKDEEEIQKTLKLLQANKDKRADMEMGMQGREAMQTKMY